MLTDRIIGFSLVGGTLAALVYYSLWVIALPFVDEDQTLIQARFPPPSYALCIPLLAGTVGLLYIGIFVAVVLARSRIKEHTD